MYLVRFLASWSRWKRCDCCWHRLAFRERPLCPGCLSRCGFAQQKRTPSNWRNAYKAIPRSSSPDIRASLTIRAMRLRPSNSMALDR